MNPNILLRRLMQIEADMLDVHEMVFEDEVPDFRPTLKTFQGRLAGILDESEELVESYNSAVHDGLRWKALFGEGRLVVRVGNLWQLREHVKNEDGFSVRLLAVGSTLPELAEKVLGG